MNRSQSSERTALCVRHACMWGSCQVAALSGVGCESVINYRSIWAMPTDVYPYPCDRMHNVGLGAKC